MGLLEDMFIIIVMLMLPLYNHDCIIYEEFYLSCTLFLP